MVFDKIIGHEKSSKIVECGEISNNLIQDNLTVPNSNLGSSSRIPLESLDFDGSSLVF